MLGFGWYLYFLSLLFNLVYYLAEIGNWGAPEEVKEWTPPEVMDTDNQYIDEDEYMNEKTPLFIHLAATSIDEKTSDENGTSSTQFIKNNNILIPSSKVADHNIYLFRRLFLDFIYYALNSPGFSYNEFQRQLGTGINLFCLQRDFHGNKTLFEFLNDQEMVNDRKELIQLLIKIDHFRYPGEEEKKESRRRIIKILRAGMKPSKIQRTKGVC